MVKNNPNLPLIGGVIAGVAASACCVGPLVLLMLGISGSWISSLTDLEPYRPIFIGISLLFVVLAYRKIYIKKEGDDCVEGEICAFPRTQRMYKYLFWVVVVFILLAFISPYFAPLFY
ncbi:MAG: mercuric transport protein [Gammaproteobacteria bacterium]|nr:mercuric transport protein [Gammaproteobacteria bacterium]